MLYKLVVIFFAAAHGLPGAYKKRAKSAERLHALGMELDTLKDALERTTGPKCCECKMSRQLMDRIRIHWEDIFTGIRTASPFVSYHLDRYTHCFEQAKSIREDGTKESCHATCEPYGTYTSGQKKHVTCHAYPSSTYKFVPPHILREFCYILLEEY